MKSKKTLHSFNKGIVSRLGLSRIDLEKISVSAETQTNFMPRVLGSMMLRPGLGYLLTTKSNQLAKYLEFIYAVNDTSLIELTPSLMRIVTSDALVTLPVVTMAITDWTFESDASVNTAWSDNDEAGSVSAWDAATGGLGLTGALTTAAIRRQVLTVNQRGVVHGIIITVGRGSASFRVGVSAGDESLVAKTLLARGEHVISFTPNTDTIVIQIENSTQQTAIVTSIGMAAAGIIEVATPWTTAANIANIRYSQSGDVLFVACKDKQQMKIERRGANSWSCVYYEPDNGPFKVENTGPAKLTPSALTGSGATLTATNTNSFFNTTDTGKLFRVRSLGQKVTRAFTALDQVTESIKITATGSSRTFPITITGTWDMTIALQRSIGDTLSFVTVASYIVNQSITYNDALDNQIVYYRLRVTAFTSNASNSSTLDYTLGTSTGIGRVTSVTNSLVAVVDVLDSFGNTTATDTWSAGIWSVADGYPTAVSLDDGRLWWAGKTRIIGSESDSYSSFNDEVDGGSSPIIRSIGFGPIDEINWVASAGTLYMGTAGNEIAVLSSILGETVTNTTFRLKQVSTQGSAAIAPAFIDNSVVFARKGGTRIFEIDEEGRTASLCTLTPDILESPVLKITVQRLPDTRVHCVRTDGKVAVLIINKVEQVFCWVLVETDGVIVDAIVLPGVQEDAVYYQVKRVIGGVDKYYLEKWALESEARNGAISKIADSFITYSGASATVITGLSHLEGKSVVAWGNSKDLGSYTVSGGQVTLSEAVTTACIGLSYTGQFKSGRLAPLTSRARIDHIGLLLLDTHYQGLEYGQDFITMDKLPLSEGYKDVAANTIHESYMEDSIEFPGQWDVGASFCLRATAPRACTITACVIEMAANE